MPKTTIVPPPCNMDPMQYFPSNAEVVAVGNGLVGVRFDLHGQPLAAVWLHRSQAESLLRKLRDALG